MTLLFVDISNAFDSLPRGKMELIRLTYSLPKETLTIILMLYNNIEVKVRSPDWDTDFFDIVTVILQRNILAPYLYIIFLDLVLRTSVDLMKENGFKLKKASSRRYPAEIIMDIDYADDIALLANTPTQAESLLHNLKPAAGGIGLHVNEDKIEYMCFNQTGDISTLNDDSLKCTSVAASHRLKVTSKCA